jgi:hypothetical protein
MEQLRVDVNTLLKEETTMGHFSGDVSKIEARIVEYLVTYIREHPDIVHETLKVHLESVLETLPRDPEYDIYEIITMARQKTLDEQKLRENGVIIKAEQARKLADEFNAANETIQFSGLSKLKIRALTEIRKSFAIGEAAYLCVYDDDDDSYREKLELIEWLKELVFRVEVIGHNRYRLN